MKQQYLNINFRTSAYNLIETMNTIVDEYVDQGFRLTTRQLYYQLVARGIIENTEKSYKLVARVVNDAKTAGLMDWDAIEDRTRAFIRRNRWTSASEMLEANARWFHMDMWHEQPCRCFVIVEKEALAGVLENICWQYDVPLLAARGYPSGTVLREFAVEDIIPHLGTGQQIKIIHLGDHDPSGIDMTRDLTERIAMFSETQEADVELTRIALTMKQIKAQKPPPNPAKVTDSRFSDYARKFGSESWELDALQPSYLADIVEQEVLQYIDDDTWEARKQQISETMVRIFKLAKTFKG